MKSSKYITTIDAGGNEGVMRRRPPNSSKRSCNFIWIFILVFALLVEPLNGKPINDKLRCRHNEVTVGQCDSRSCTCITCPTCPPGQGLLPLCGTSVIKKEEIQCVPCKSGTFSAENSTESCQPCHQCDGQKTLRNCTSTQNTECSTDCIDGRLKDTITERCEEVIPPPRSTILKPFQPPTTVQSTTTSDSKNSKKQVVKSTQITTTDKNGLQTKITVAEENHASQIYVIKVTSISTLAIIFLAVVVCFLSKKRKNIMIRKLICRLHRKMTATDVQSQEDEFNDPKDSTPMNPTGSDGHAFVLLKDIGHELAEKISVQISRPNFKGWKPIGWKLKIPEENLVAIETYSSCSSVLPGRSFLEFLQSSQPNLTLKRFVEVLKSIQRNDVVQDIQDEYQNS